MTRSRSALVAALAGLALLAGCTGGDASQSDVQDKVADRLTEAGYDGQDLTATEVAAASACVAQTLFDPGQFTKDERNEVSSSADSEPPPGELRDRFVVVVEGCIDDATDAAMATAMPRACRRTKTPTPTTPTATTTPPRPPRTRTGSEHRPQEGGGPGLVERLVPVPALG